MATVEMRRLWLETAGDTGMSHHGEVEKRRGDEEEQTANEQPEVTIEFDFWAIGRRILAS